MITQEQVDLINACETPEEALTLTGKFEGDNTHARLAYIKAMRGYRAVGGFFEPTRSNVTYKFVKVWRESKED